VRGEDLGDVNELAVSMSSIGQQEPVIVEQLGERRYRLIEGHRRRKAARVAGITHLDAVLRRRPGDCDRIIRQLAMHTHAKPFEPIAEARALHTLMWTYRLTRDQIATKVGRGPMWVRDRLALLQLTETEQVDVEQRALPISEALDRVRQRRAERDGRQLRRPTPGPRTTRRRPAEQHLTHHHPLAADARQRCRDAGGEHRYRVAIGDVACGECWEHAIRADQQDEATRGHAGAAVPS
jgi:ParB-like partition proteins